MNEEVLSDYFDSVERFSQEHINDLKMLHNMQQKMMKTGSGSTSKAAASFGETISRLNNYIAENHIILSNEEAEDLHEISHAKLAPEVIRRLLEDFYHTLKHNHSDTMVKREMEEQLAEEIAAVRTGRGFFDCLRVTIFALKQNTITPFSHKYQEYALKMLKGTLYSRVELLCKNLLPVLNRNYYLLSTVEYNSLALFLELKSALEDLRKIPLGESYSPKSIRKEMDRFSALYGKIYLNRELIRETFQRVMKGHKLDHGLWATVNSVLDKTLKENRLLNPSYETYFSSTYTGAVVSFYTSCQGVVIRTLNQVLYLLEESSAIDQEVKHLTHEAKANMDKEQERSDSRENKIVLELENSDRILEQFIKKGPEIIERIVRIDAGQSYSGLVKELKSRPLLWLSHCLSGLNRLVFPYLLDKDKALFRYEGTEYPLPYEKVKGLIEAAEALSPERLNLTGGRNRDLAGIRQPEQTSREQFLSTILRPGSLDKMMSPAFKELRELLMEISGKIYTCAGKVNEIITKYEEHKYHDDGPENYSYGFMVGAFLGETHSRSLARILDFSSDITPYDILAAASSVLYYINAILGHEGIEAIRQGREKLRKELAEFQPGASSEDDEELNFDEEVEEAISNNLVQELNRVYRDSLTGLWKYEYFQDQMVARYYNDEGLYPQERVRFIILAEIDNLQKINNVYGYNAGDEALITLAGLLKEHFGRKDSPQGNVVTRYLHGSLMAIVNDSTQPDVIEQVMDVLDAVREKSVAGEKGKLSSIAASCSIYREHTNSEGSFSFFVAEKLLQQCRNNGGDCVSFIRDQNLMVSERDFGADRNIRPDLVGIIR